MSAPVWMPLYIERYLADTTHLSTIEHGAYLLLIMHYWVQDGLPADDAKLARICRLDIKGWMAMRDTIAEFFTPDWRHHRIDAELLIANELITKQKVAGRIAGLASAAAKRQRIVQRQGNDPSTDRSTIVQRSVDDPSADRSTIVQRSGNDRATIGEHNYNYKHKASQEGEVLFLGDSFPDSEFVDESPLSDLLD